MNETTSYWIQEQAPNGGFFDSVGLALGTSEAEAITQARMWRRSWPNRVVRLVARTNTVIEI